MWRSDKSDEPKSKVLPSSGHQLAHAKGDRVHATPTSFFREMQDKWKPVVRPRVEVEEQAPMDPNDPNLPAWLRHRPASKEKPLFFRTTSGATRKKK